MAGTVDDFFYDVSQSARTSLVGSMDDDPEEAARAITVGKTTGMAPESIVGNLDDVERQNKAALGSAIIDDNHYIADYLASNPMAPRVSHDDLGQMDVASTRISDVLPDGAVKRWLKSDTIQRSFMEGFGDAPIGLGAIKTDRDYQLAKDYPMFAATWGAAMTPVELMGRTFGGLLHMTHDALAVPFGDKFAKEATGMLEYMMMRGDIGVKAAGGGATGPLGIIEQNQKMFKGMSDAVRAADPYLRTDTNPPPGVHPILDDIKKKESQNDIKALDDALSESVKSATRDRAPDLYAQFVKGHVGDREIGIDSAAIRELYGDKVPEIDDNILGWAPDIAKRLEAAELSGTDVQIPLSEWLAKVDPDVAKQLHDHIRVREGGLTLEEGKALEPKEVVPEPHTLVRGSAGLEPLFSVGDRKVTLQRATKVEGPEGRFGPSEGFHDFDLLDQNGKIIGAINLSVQKGGKQVYIEDIHAGPREKKYYDPNFLGPSLIRDLKRQLREAFPEAEELTGHRATGARWKGKPDTAVDVANPMPVVKFDIGDAADVQKFRDLLNAHWEDVGSNVTALFKTDEKGLAADSPMGQMIMEEVRRVVGPRADVDVAHGLAEGKKSLYGVYIPDIKSIIVSLESPDPIGTGRHEAIHSLRDMQLFSAEEWRTLEASSIEHGWDKKYEIDKRWGDLPSDVKVEESIAEAYRDWAAGAAMPPEAVTLFQRMKEFFDGLLKRVSEHLGLTAATWEDVFKRVESGEVGAREAGDFADDAMVRAQREEAKAANDLDAFQRERVPTYDAAARNQQIERLVDKDTKRGDWKYWDKVAQENNITIGGRGNVVSGYAAAREYSRDGKTTLHIDDVGRRSVYQDGKLAVRERNRDIKAQPAGEGPGLYDKAKALGVTQGHMDRMLNLIRKRNEEDLAHVEKRATEQQRRSQTKEWKARRTELRDEVREQLEARPDLATDELFAKGQIKIYPDFLTEEQKASLPKEYIQKKNGVNPDELAPYFGYTSGQSLVDRLGVLTEDRRQAGMSQRDYLNRLIDVETDRRLNAEFGDLGKNVMEAAKDQALSETQLNLVHEETLAYALAAGEEPKFTKESVREMVKQSFDQTPVGQISSDRLLQTAGKIGKKIEEAEAKGKWDEAYRLSQQRNHAVVEAKMARDYERARKSFDRTAKVFRKREIGSVAQEWTNWVHDLMIRVGLPVNRSIQDLAENIGRQSEGTLRDFVEAKEAEWMGLREVPIADYLLDERFRKNLDELSHFDFMGLKESIDGLYKAGRDEKKIYREGEAADRDVVLREMRDKLATFPLKEFPATKGVIRKALDLPKLFMAGMTNIETLMNRWDRADPRGIFNRYVSYPLAKASNQKNVLEREYARVLEKLGPIKDRNKLVDAPFADPLSRTDANPDGTRWTGFTRNNVLAMLQNAGNKGNWNVLARGYGMNPDSLMAWLIKNTTKEDWDRAQKMGDSVFKSLVGRADKVYEQITGATIEKIPLEPVNTPYGQYEGWYHPLISDPLRKEVWVQDQAGQWQRKPTGKKGSVYDDGDFFHASTANGYTKRRTGAIYPLDLNFDVVPARIKQMIHDVAFRQTILETEKIFNNKSFHAEVTKHYGEPYSDLLMPYLKNMAGAESINSRAQSKAAQVSEFLRQNVISTYIGFNPYTALKHGPTAWVMSMREVGAKDFLGAAMSLYGKSSEIGLSNSQFAMKWSEELQRRERHWQDTIAGEHASLEGSKNIRSNIIEKGSWLVAQSDMLSAKPTWVAAYNKYVGDGLSHGESIDLADRAVRRAHGSTSQTNQPSLVRGGGPLHGWLTSVYGFFGTAMQRRIEIAHELNDTYKLGREGEIKKAAANVPGLAADIFTYVIWPTIIEEWVTGLTTDDRRGWGTHLAAGAFMGLSSSVLYLRDIAHAAVTGHDPGVGLLSSGLHDMNQLLRDFKKGKESMNKQHAGKTVGDTLTVFGELTGMAPKTIANAIHFGIDLVNKQTNPKTPGEVVRGVTRGTTKLRVEK